jgi:hypothetical protein
MHYSRNLYMFCSIQTHRHIDTSSIKFHIKHSMQSICNCIHMFRSIQIHRHIDTSSHESHCKICHTSSSCYACSSSVFISFWCRGYADQRYFISWCLGVCIPRVFSSVFCSMYMLVL